MPPIRQYGKIKGPMKFAVISDIHGNGHALARVLDEIAREGFDLVMCLGDTVEGGPQPAEVAATLRALDLPMVMGNCDEWFASWPLLTEDTLLHDHIRWTAERLTPDDLVFIRGFQPTVTVPLDDISVLGFHGSPRSNREHILAETPGSDLAAMVEGWDATVMIGGHTHLQMVRRHGKSIVVNAGSVGLPRGPEPTEGPFANPPWAEWAAISNAGGHLGVELRRTPLDVPTMVAMARSSGMPEVENWIAGWERGLER
jgi:putative phosphoesterase